MGFAIRIALYVVAGALLLGAFWFFFQSLSARSSATKQAYGVARQAERLKMMQATFWGVGLVIFALVFGAVAVLTAPSNEESTAEPTLEPTPVPTADTSMTPTVDLTAVPTPTDAPPSPTPTPLPPAVSTVESAEPTITAESTATTVEATPTTNLPFLYVNSPVVGLYLRVAPNGEILELLEHRAAVTLVGESQTVEGIEWVRVTAVSGNQGWVARGFLVTTQPSE